MDFDKQYGNGAAAGIVNKGRGFNEKPLVMPTVNRRHSRARSAPRKINSKTEFVITKSKGSQRRVLSGRAGGFNNQRGSRNDMFINQTRGIRRVNNNSFNNQWNNRRNIRSNNRNGGRRNNNRRRLPTEEEMNNQLNKYFEKDEDVMKQRLDSELQQFNQQAQAMNQTMENPAMTQPVMSENQPMQ